MSVLAVPLAVLLLASSAAAHAETPRLALIPAAAPPAAAATPGAPPPDARWAASFAAFDQADHAGMPAAGGTVFVGSSSIRLWKNLAHAFAGDGAVIQRGFGGSRLQDCAAHAQRLVVAYRPRQVVVYAGDNDLAEGRTPEQVLASFVDFVDTVRRDLPDTRIGFIAIKPSPARVALLERIRAANQLIRAYIDTDPHTRFIDVFTPMLDAEGAPRGDLYVADRLHMNEAGYRIWENQLAAYLR